MPQSCGMSRLYLSLSLSLSCGRNRIWWTEQLSCHRRRGRSESPKQIDVGDHILNHELLTQLGVLRARLCDLHKVRTVQQSKRSASLSPRCQMQLWNSLHYRPQPMCQEMSLRLSDPLPAFREDLETRLMMEWTLAPGFHDLPVYSSLSMRREGLCCWSLSYGTHYYSSGTLHGFYSPFEQGGNSIKTYPCQNYETHHVVNSSTPPWLPLDFWMGTESSLWSKLWIEAPYLAVNISSIPHGTVSGFLLTFEWEQEAHSGQ